MNLPPPPLACVPPRWARGAHLQTVLANYLGPAVPDLPWRRHRLDLADGDALALRSVEGRSDLAVVLLHGLGGSADGHYMRRAAARFSARGHAVLAVNHRGAGEGLGLARGTYHSGATGDVAACLAFARELFPGRRLAAVGFSISANMLLVLLGRDRHLARPDLAIAVNPPGDLEACSRRLVTGFNRVYDRYFVRRLRREVHARPGQAPLPPTATLRDFDAVYTAPAAGFPSREAYYAGCSCAPHLAGIETPTVVLSAADDPFAPASDLLAHPRAAAVTLHVEPTGGHMGYISANLPDRRWLDHALGHYLAALSG